MREEAWFTCQFTNSYALFVLSKKKRDRHWNRYRNDDESHLPRLFHPRADFDLRIRYRYALIKGTGWMEFFQIRSSSKLVGYCISFFFFSFSSAWNLESDSPRSCFALLTRRESRNRTADLFVICLFRQFARCPFSFQFPDLFFFLKTKINYSSLLFGNLKLDHRQWWIQN